MKDIEFYHGWKVTNLKENEKIKQSGNITSFSRVEKDFNHSQMNVYHIMEGLDFSYNHFNSKNIMDISYTSQALDVIEINHCRQGRFGCEINESPVYLGPGEIEANILGVVRGNPEFPLGYYEGISIMIDVVELTKSINTIFPNIIISLKDLKDKIEKGGGALLICVTPQLENIFNELYQVDPTSNSDYIKVKTFEILTLLQTIPYDRKLLKQSYYRRSDLAKIKQLRNYAINNLNKRIPFDVLINKFNLSSTLAKNTFKEVYGMPYYTYMKNYRIHKALHYLQDESLSIGEIAILLGYENASKFSSAFKSIVKINPNQYRKENVQMEHLEIFGVEIDE